MFLKKPKNRGFFVLFYLFVIIVVVYAPQSICSYKQDQISNKELTLFWLMALEVRQFKCKAVSSTWHYVSVLLLHLIVVECIMWQFRWKLKRFCIANSINRNKADGIIISDFKMHCWAILIKTSQYWQRKRHGHQRNRTDATEINPHICSQLIFCKPIKLWKKDL